MLLATKIHSGLVLGAGLTLCAPLLWAADPVLIEWHAVDDAITKPLGGLVGDAARGRTLVIHKGNCLTCHRLPIPEEGFHGSIGPSLVGVGARLSAGQLRLRIVDEQRLNPMTIMPGFYKDPATHNQVAWEYAGKTMLSAQDIEDVVAYLVTLK